MAASSQYHRGATSPHSHYQSLPNILPSAHDHLYADLATSWHTSHALSRAPASSAAVHRFSASAAQRPFTGHYLDYNGPGDYVNPPSQSQPTWPASYLRPAAQTWSEPLNNDSFASRTHPFGDVEGRGSVPHSNATPVRHYQHASTGASMLMNAPAEETAHQHQNQLPSVVSSSPDAPPFHHQTPNLAPVASLLNHSNPSLHLQSPQVPSQAPVSWPAGSSSDVAPPSPPQHSSHTGHALSSDVVLSGQASLSSPAWGLMSEASSSTLANVEPAWPNVEAQSENPGYLHQGVPNQMSRAVSAARGHRRSSTRRRSLQLATVPAAFVQRQEKLKISKRNGPLTDERRQKTHRMRKEKMTCIRCRFYKSGCDLKETCEKCSKIGPNARSFKLPCTRDRLEDASLVRHCNGRSSQEEGEFLPYDWLQSGNLFDMEIIWNLPWYGPIAMAQPMRITYRQYHPKQLSLDTATSIWSNTEGQVKVVEQPPYAIYDTASLVAHFERYFTSLQPAIEGWVFDRIQHDEIAFLTYTEVLRMRQKRPPGNSNLLDLAMRIQCISVVSQGYGTVWSNDIPGIQEYDYGKMGRSPYEAYDRNTRDRPLPGAINQQMDVAAIKCMKRLEKLCLKEFSSRTFTPKIKPWYELFLALYVLFWNMEYIHRGAKQYIMTKNGTAIESHVNSVVSNQLKKWDWAFQVLFYHWCAIIRNYCPFKLARENPEELREKGHVDREGYEYVMKVTGIFDRIGGLGQSTSPHIGYPPTHNSLSSEWIKALFKEAGA